MIDSVQLVSLLDGLAGRTFEARAAVETLGHVALDGHIVPSKRELAVAGDPSTALRLLEQAVERGFYPHDYIAVHCPFLAALRGSPEFERIVAGAADRVAAFSA